MNFFYRTTAGVEVDLICEYQNKLQAFEIKFSKSISKDMVKALILFKKDYLDSELTLLSLHDKKINLTREVEAVHWSQILKS